MPILFAKRKELFVPVLLDAEDVVRLRGRRLSIGSHGYAQMWASESGRHIEVLHRWVMGAVKGDGNIIDHINGVRTDNRRANLRIVDASGSSQNVRGRGRSPYRGVYLVKGRWSARVKFQGQVYYLGSYDTQEEAAAVAEAKRIELMPSYVTR